MIIILHPTALVTLRVLYFIPRTHLLNEFLWQTDDLVPEMPRVHRFLAYWHDNIDAIISEVETAYGQKRGWRHLSS